MCVSYTSLIFFIYRSICCLQGLPGSAGSKEISRLTTAIVRLTPPAPTLWHSRLPFQVGKPATVALRFATTCLFAGWPEQNGVFHLRDIPLACQADAQSRKNYAMHRESSQAHEPFASQRGGYGCTMSLSTRFLRASRRNQLGIMCHIQQNLTWSMCSTSQLQSGNPAP